MEKFSQDVPFRRIFGGLAMPSGNAAGFAVVIGETCERGYQGKRKYIFLDEVEEWDSRDFIERVGWLDYRYSPEKWFGNVRDVALDKYVRELNKELANIESPEVYRRGLKVTLPGLLLGKEQDRPFTVIVPDLNRLLGGRERDKDKQRLFLKEGSKLMTYMKSPQLGDTASMTFDDYPAVSALAFAVLELERKPRRPRPEKVINEYKKI